MTPLPPRSTPTYTLFPYTTLFRSRHSPAGTERDDNPFAIAPIARHLAGRERQLKSAVGKLSANAMLAPLRVAVFRRTWSASLFSNFGLLVQGVGAAWAMTELTSAADMVALEIGRAHV